jgi:hypothetical protein
MKNCSSLYGQISKDFTAPLIDPKQQNSGGDYVTLLAGSHQLGWGVFAPDEKTGESNFWILRVENQLGFRRNKGNEVVIQPCEVETGLVPDAFTFALRGQFAVGQDV